MNLRIEVPKESGKEEIKSHSMMTSKKGEGCGLGSRWVEEGSKTRVEDQEGML